jgi:hypothetical protein
MVNQEPEPGDQVMVIDKTSRWYQKVGIVHQINSPASTKPYMVRFVYGDTCSFIREDIEIV